MSIILVASRVFAVEEPVWLAFAAGLSVGLVISMAVALDSSVPLVLDRPDIDPPVANGMFVTTRNDILVVLVYFIVASSIYLGGWQSVEVPREVFWRTRRY